MPESIDASSPDSDPRLPRPSRVRSRALTGAIAVLAAAAATVGIASCGSKSKSSDTTVAAAAVETTAPAAAAPETTATAAAAAPETTAAAGAVESTAPAATEATPAAATAGCPKADGSSPQTKTFTAVQPTCIDAAKTYKAIVVTSKGSFTITFDAKKAPITVNNFVVLARYHYFDGSGFHRVVPNFVIQGGSPDGTGAGGPGYTFQDELPRAGEYKIGSVAMANAGPNTNDAQFFVITGPNGAALPPSYSLFGQVTDGIATIDAIAALGVGDGPPSEPVAITKVTIEES